QDSTGGEGEGLEEEGCCGGQVRSIRGGGRGRRDSRYGEVLQRRASTPRRLAPQWDEPLILPVEGPEGARQGSGQQAGSCRSVLEGGSPRQRAGRRRWKARQGAARRSCAARPQGEEGGLKIGRAS